ncbi:hypothetical protein PoB_006850400 [Plakobranchus ocellatus]|uniref:Uncharacterized protein n=1 Tax=Plakobranchus ocellatus TaxID=259542 RepID=A0AAV4DCX9_9GAST|nr:hypothetical protein PoB_006850400 [Plakobranchus ocellatus]
MSPTAPWQPPRQLASYSIGQHLPGSCGFSDESNRPQSTEMGVQGSSGAWGALASTHISVMSGVIPGHKNKDSAQEYICVLPWCAG